MISKSDFKLNHKELEKIIPETYRDLVLILDDNVEVWKKYKDNLVQVFPYYYWLKEEDNEVIRITNQKDYHLHYLASFIDRAVTLYKKFKQTHSSSTLKLYRIVKVLHSYLFWNRHIHFTCVVGSTNPEDVLTIRESIIVKQKRGLVTLDFEKANLIVANTFKATKKIKQAKAKGLPTVHFTWIRYSVVNLAPMSVEFFDLTNIKEDKLTESIQFEKEMYEYHTDE